MKYSAFIELYEKLSGTTKKLEKTKMLAEFLPRLKGHEEWIYLLRGRVFADYDIREFGISTQLVLKAISRASGLSLEAVGEKFKKIGDLGDVAHDTLKHKKQKGLFSKELDVGHVLESLRKLCEVDGKGSVDKKLGIISELLISASNDEARYLIRTLLSDLRVGVADALLIDAIVECFFGDEKEEDNEEEQKMKERVKHAYDLMTDFAGVLEMASKGKKEFEHIRVLPGKPLNVMLPVKVTELEEAFRICGKRVAVEHKYDGFRVVVSKSDNGEVRLFTRRLEDVTRQFPDVVKFVKEHVKAKSFILDSEAVGYDPVKKKYLPFESVSQRIKRKYDIEELSRKMPVELNVFDILYLNGENSVELPFIKRRKLLERIIKDVKWELRLATQIITDDIKEAERFYKDALKIGEEGIMVKNIDASYKAGRLVGYIVKMKPEVADLDLVIVGAEYGTGKRFGGLTSYIVACRNGISHAQEFLEVGRVSSGLKEKSQEGETTYKELNEILQPLIIAEKAGIVKVKPKVVVSVTYQNIQHSPTYSSGFAMRFPRITHYRPERGTNDIATLEDIKKEVARGQRLRKGGEG